MTLRGSIDAYGHCWVPITIVGLRQEIFVEAILDTGFDGWVCLPMRLAVQLGLELCGFQTVELADGTRKEELVFSGEVIFGDKRGEVDITLTSGGDTLVGLGLLANSVMTIDLVGRNLEIVQKEE
jgi:predicted aspartyl protease